MRDIDFLPCKKCEFYDGYVTCIINNRNLYTDFLKEPHCKNFILKGIYSKDDIECILKEKKNDRGLGYEIPNRGFRIYIFDKLLKL